MAFFLLIFLLGGELAFSSEKVRVRVLQKLEQLELVALGLDLSAFKTESRQNQLSPLKPQKLYVRRIKKEDRWLWQLKYGDDLVHTAKKNLTLSAASFKKSVEPLPPELTLKAESGALFDVLTFLSIEDYLLGVLPAEMPSYWPIEALKAQAVASRSYMHSHLRSKRYRHFDVEASVYDQVYRWPGLLPASSLRRIRQVLKETKGEVLVSSKGVLKAYYHADCGGHTAQAQAIWGVKENYKAVKDAHCPLSPWGKWSYQLTKNLLLKKLKSHLKGEESPIVDVSVIQRSASERARTLKIINERNKEFTVSAHDFRESLGFSKVKSTLFYLSWKGENLTISGQGHGHGVGLCQWGARQLAQRGVGYQKILAHYYPQAFLRSHVLSGLRPQPSRHEPQRR